MGLPAPAQAARWKTKTATFQHRRRAAESLGWKLADLLERVSGTDPGTAIASVTAPGPAEPIMLSIELPYDALRHLLKLARTRKDTQPS